jgi:hypothetical protein
MRRSALLATTLAISSLAIAPDMFAASDRTAQSLTDRVLTCFRAEGGVVRPNDRAAVLARLSDPAVMKPIATAFCGPLVESSSCADTLAEATCSDLARRIEPSPRKLAPELQPFGRAIAQRLLECWSTESRHRADDDTADLPPRDEVDKSVLAFTERLVHVMGTLAETGECRVREDELQACVASLRTRACRDVAFALLPPKRRGNPKSAEAAALPTSPIALCPAFFVCGTNQPIVRDVLEK